MENNCTLQHLIPTNVYNFYLVNNYSKLFDPCVPTAAEKTNQVSGEANSDQSGQEERGDLIQFYNSVFVLKMKSFALRYAIHDNRVRHSHSLNPELKNKFSTMKLVPHI